MADIYLKTVYKCGGEENDLRGNVGFPYTLEQSSWVRTWNMHDVDQIIYADEFRKLSDKIQLLPYEHPRNRTRLIHTLEVVRIAKEIARNLDLNLDLTEAIALGHDLGNSALGRAGNFAVQEKCHVHHQEISALLAEILSTRKALSKTVKKKLDRKKFCYITHKKSNISYLAARICETDFEFPIQPEVIDGIRKHSDGPFPSTLEGQVVRHADNFAYIVQDIDDALKAGIITKELFKEMASKDKINGRSWRNLNQVVDIPNGPDLKSLYSINTGERVGALITRFVEYHKRKKNTRDCYEFIKSDFVEPGEVPTLDIDEGLNHVIESVWKFISENIHNNPIILSAQNLYRHYAELIIEMLNEDWELYIDFNRYIDECVRNTHHEKNIYDSLSYHPKFSKLSQNTRIAFILNSLSFHRYKRDST